MARVAGVAPGEPAAERDDYGKIILARRLHEAPARLNPDLPSEALDDAARRLIRSESVDLVALNRFMPRTIVDSVIVEYRSSDLLRRWDPIGLNAV